MASADNQAPEIAKQRSWFLFRSADSMLSLPPEYRWEFTRRHPHYLQFWQAALRHHQQAITSDGERELNRLAVLILSGIGFSQSAIPPDPRLEFEALTGELQHGGAWGSGAVAPAMLRTLAHMLLLALPASERSMLGCLLEESAEFDSQDTEHMTGIHQKLSQFVNPVWNSFPNAPVVSVNLQMPQRAITEAIEQLVHQWKQEQGIPEHRRRDNKLDEYLAIWDMREGWAHGVYDVTREMRFEAIAQKTHTPISTAVSRYRTAFEYLSGHEYTPDLWIRLVGPLKLSRYGSAQAGQGLILRRPWKSPNLRPVTEAVLLPGRTGFDDPDLLKATTVDDEAIAWVDLAMDIETLIARGRSNEEIVEELEMPLATINDLVADIRARHDSR